MSICTDIYKAVEKLYSTFKPPKIYPRLVELSPYYPLNLEGPNPYFTQEELDPFRTTPIKELSTRDLSRYAFKAMTT